jgi:hypothetical protein
MRERQAKCTVVTRRRAPTPLSSEQIAAAVRLHENHLPQWQAADEALEAVRTSFQADFSYSANLVRIATVNTLYGTNLKAVHRMAGHIESILPRGAELLEPAELVEAIAALPPAPGERARRHRSFASKFCHFFVNADDFPIFDSAARDALRLHLGSESLKEAESSYTGFCGALAGVRRTYSLAASARDIDRYLWIAGIWLAFARGRRDINRELLALFERQPRPLELSCIIDHSGEGQRRARNLSRGRRRAR